MEALVVLKADRHSGRRPLRMAAGLQRCAGASTYDRANGSENSYCVPLEPQYYGQYHTVVDLEEKLDQLKTRRRSVRPHVLDALLIEAGFVRRRGKGDHWVYTHPARRYPLTIDPRNPLLPSYVSNAIRAIEEVLASENN